MTGREFLVIDIGRIDFCKAWKIQERLHARLIEHKLARRTALSTPLPPHHYLLFCEHPHVITLGRNANRSNVLLAETYLREKGIQLVHTNRGGDVTYHGPGQVVGYPIMDLELFREDIGWYLRSLEEVIIRVLARYHITAKRLKGATGVWLEADDPRKARKICAIGVRCSRWVTMHGFALNVNTDLSYFSYIVPCGIANKGVTSIERELGRRLPLGEVKQAIVEEFGTVFEARLLWVSAKTLVYEPEGV